MNILLNGDNYNTPTKITLHDLISALNLTPGNFAIAVNTQVIPKSNYLNIWLKDNDRVEIVTALQGG